MPYEGGLKKIQGIPPPRLWLPPGVACVSLVTLTPSYSTENAVHSNLSPPPLQIPCHPPMYLPLYQPWTPTSTPLGCTPPPPRLLFYHHPHDGDDIWWTPLPDSPTATISCGILSYWSSCLSIVEGFLFLGFPKYFNPNNFLYWFYLTIVSITLLVGETIWNQNLMLCVSQMAQPLLFIVKCKIWT